jgi:hypothetical protein
MITPAEMSERDAWFAAAFGNVTAPATETTPYLVQIANQWGRPGRTRIFRANPSTLPAQNTGAGWHVMR